MFVFIFIAADQNSCKQKMIKNINILGVSYISANIYCKSRNLPNTDAHNYSIDLW